MLPLPNIEFDLPDMEKSGLVQKISPEEIKMGDKLIGVIQLTTEIALIPTLNFSSIL